MKKTLIGFGVVALMFGGVVSASATNITINDGTDRVSPTGVNVGGEDQETEPGMVNSQIWDLEGFFQTGNELSMVGGYNFVTGQSGYDSGDIFISTDDLFGSTQAPDGYTPASGNNSVASSFGYEYVLDLNFDDMSYDVLALGSTDTTLTAWYTQNEEDLPGSNPWRYESGGEFVTSGFFNFTSGLSDTDTGFLGGTHYELAGFDLSFLGDDQEFWSHFTMGCGNDNLMGNGTTPVPEPATMLLFGTGLIGLVGLRRRKKK